MTIITSPDQKKEFKVWHFCPLCGLRWKQPEFEQAKKHMHNDVRTVSTDKPFIVSRA